MNTRHSCWSIPSERVVCLLWVKRTYPTTWRVLWARIAKAWQRG